MAPALDSSVERVIRLVDQTFDPFRWRNVAGPGRLNKQVRHHAEGCVLSISIDPGPELRLRVWISRRGPAYRLIGTAVRLRIHRVRIARTLARIADPGSVHQEMKPAGPLLIGR